MAGADQRQRRRLLGDAHLGFHRRHPPPRFGAARRGFVADDRARWTRRSPPPFPPASTTSPSPIHAAGTRFACAAFTSLGPDEEAPIVTIETPKPGSIIGAETRVSVSFTADDGAGLLEALEATVTPAGISAETPCRTGSRGPAAQATCQFQFTAPTPTGDNDMIVIDARARGQRRKRSSQPPVPYRLARRPSLTGLTPSDWPGQRRHADRGDRASTSSSRWMAPRAPSCSLTVAPSRPRRSARPGSRP